MRRHLAVLGFAFDTDDLGVAMVALVKKARPDWQRGKFNGIGGHVMDGGETVREAMRREWLEETGTLVDSWRLCFGLYGPDYTVCVFMAIDPIVATVGDVGHVTDEPVYLFKWRNLPFDCVHDVNWMVPMVLDRRLRLNHIDREYEP